MSQTTDLSDPDDVDTIRIETIVGDGLARVVLHGEADFSTLADLDAALVDVAHSGAGLVHVDASTLGFADIATVRRLALFARDARRRGVEVRTVGANGTIRTVAGHLEVQDDLGLS